MRTWLILLALVALVCAGTSQQKYRGSRNRRNLLRSDNAIRSLRDGEEAAAVGQPQQQNNGEHQQQNNGESQQQHNGESQQQHNGELQPQHNGEPQQQNNGEHQQQNNGEHQQQNNGQPQEQHNGESQQQNNGESNHQPSNGEKGEPIVLKGEEAKKKALMARKVVHESAATALGSHATLLGFTQYTDVNVQLLTDVINGKSTGTPYVYIYKNDITEKDLQKDVHVTLLFSRVSIDDSCKKLPLNGIDPKCEKAILVGKLIKVEEDSDEYKAAREELVKKFCGLKHFGPNEFVLRKMVVETVFVPDHEGRPLIVPNDIYNAVDPETVVGRTANQDSSFSENNCDYYSEC